MIDGEVFVIYERPADYPNNFVVRGYHLGKDPGDLTFYRPQPAKLANSLTEARSLVPSDRVCFSRDSLDEPCIVETWL